MKTLFIILLLISNSIFAAGGPSSPLPSINTGAIIFRHDPYIIINYGIQCSDPKKIHSAIDKAFPNNMGIRVEESVRIIATPDPDIIKNHDFFVALCAGEQLWRVTGADAVQPVKTKSFDQTGQLVYKDTNITVKVGTRCHGLPLESTDSGPLIRPLLPPFNGLYAECIYITDAQAEAEMDIIRQQQYTQP